MDGGIYTRQKCTVCKENLKHDERRKGCFCPDHPDQRATSFIVKFPGGIYQRYKSYEKAAQALNYLRYEKGTRKNLFNPDDYRSFKPNSFGALNDKYLARKKDRASYRKIAGYIERASKYFGKMNMREITGADIEDYLYSIKGISEKTRFNHMTQLRDFWKWCLARGNIITLAEMPAFPEIKYELGWRKVTTWKNQELVLNKIKETTYKINPKIWLAADMLATYTELRPDDIRRMTEGSLDDEGYLTIHKPTKVKNRFKTIRLHPDHLIEWRAIQKQFPGLPDTLFFRHVTTVANRKEGTRWGINYLKEQWDKACAEIGLEGISLYNGTKHTTATETARLLGSEKAERASGLTNKAFRRYNQAINDGAFEVVTAIKKAKKKAKVIPISKGNKVYT